MSTQKSLEERVYNIIDSTNENYGANLATKSMMYLIREQMKKTWDEAVKTVILISDETGCFSDAQMAIEKQQFLSQYNSNENENRH